MKINVDSIFNLNENHIKILKAAESLLTSHLYVKIDILRNRSRINGNFNDLCRDLLNLKLLAYKEAHYKISISGLDALALLSLKKRGLQKIIAQIGIGKESDIYKGIYKNKEVVLKINRLGRTSYRKIQNRDLKEDTWYKINKENCEKEYENINLLGAIESVRPFIVEAYDLSRHILILKYYDYFTLYKVKVENYERIAEQIMEFQKALLAAGFVHCDFNEFNILVKEDKIIVIDFPQIMKVEDKESEEYYKKGIENIKKYFKKKNNYDINIDE